MDCFAALAMTTLFVTAGYEAVYSAITNLSVDARYEAVLYTH